MNTINSNTNPSISTRSSLDPGSDVTPIYLNLYDLGGCNNTCIHSIGVLFYHCAVQTHSTEYGYMGHPYRFTGLYKTSKYDSRFHLYRFRHSVEIGWTCFNEKQIDQIINGLKPFYRGLDYHTTKKNSIHFAKYLLEQLSNDVQSKHLKPMTIVQFPSYIDRARRLTETFEFLQIFDREKEMAEINILFFLYMKYKGNIKQICQILQCDTIDKLKRSVELIEQGIEEKKLPIFPLFTTFDLRRADEYLDVGHEDNADVFSNNEQLTLTEIFHQFDTITLRGRTSVDRYLNIQRTKDSENEQKLFLDSSLPTHKTSIKQNADPPILSHIQRFSQPQSQNQVRTPPTSDISGLTITSHNSPRNSILTNPLFQFEHLHRRRAIPIHTTLRPKETTNLSSSSSKRKLPRDLELSNDLYKMTNQSSLRHNYTNNALSSSSDSHQSIVNVLSFENVKSNEDIDSSV